MKKINRPWQATTLVILGGTKLVLTLLIALLLLFAQQWFGEAMSQLNPNFIVITAIKPVIFIPLILSLFLIFFVVRGLFIGQKWAPIFLTVAHGLSLIFTGMWMVNDIRWSIPFAITLFVLALDIECVMSPFFGKQK